MKAGVQQALLHLRERNGDDRVSILIVGRLLPVAVFAPPNQLLREIHSLFHLDQPGILALGGQPIEDN